MTNDNGLVLEGVEQSAKQCLPLQNAKPPHTVSHLPFAPVTLGTQCKEMLV